MDRMDFQRQNVFGKILNVGCGEDPVGLSAFNCVNVDLDVWDVPNFVQADAHELPFSNGSFDCVVLGDILEHVLDPRKVVEEACRVSRKRVVITVPEETRIGDKPGQYIAEGFKQKLEEVMNQGYISLEDYKINYPLFQNKCLEAVPDEKIPHTFHINRFDDTSIRNLIDVEGWHVKTFMKVQEQFWLNWLIVLEKDDGKA